MFPYKGGKANQGHSCVKGRFAFGYATHKDRVTEPMLPDSIDQALGFAGNKIKNIQVKYGCESVGINPLRGQNNVQGSCDMDSFPQEIPSYQDVCDDRLPGKFEKSWCVNLDNEPNFSYSNYVWCRY